jgi:replicative DNA helicase
LNHAEEVLFSHLTNADSLDYLVREGFSSSTIRECIPGDLAPEIVGWVLDVYFRSGRSVAPTREGILETWGDRMEKIDLVIEDQYETDSIEWAVTQLRTQFAEDQVNELTIQLANELTNAAPPDKTSVVKEYSGRFHALTNKLISHYDEMPLDIGLDQAWARYQERAIARMHIQGLTFGLPEIDAHTMGVRDGEMAVFAGYAGSGKTWMAIKTALAEWRRGRRSVLYTLENSVEMIIDRMACMMAGLDYARWQKGTVEGAPLERFHVAKDRIQQTEHAPIIIMPERGDRDPVSLVRRVFALGGESVIIDQLSHIEAVIGTRTHKRNEIVMEIMKELYVLISEGKEKIAALVLAQINREGKDAAARLGRYDMEHLAESSEMERTPDFVFSLLRQPTETNEDGALLQKLKGRRVEERPEAWEMVWRLGVGDIRVMREVALSA